MYQKTTIVGHVGGPPDMRYTPEGTPVTTFSVATNRRWKDKDGETQERVTWFRVTAWNALAETCAEYLAKGSLVLVEGDIAASAWMDKSTGAPRAALELNARAVRFLARAQARQEDEPPPPPRRS